MSEQNSEMTPTLESWRSEKEDIYDRFLEEFGTWSLTGKEPRDGDQDIRFFLELEEKRLKNKGLRMRHIITPVGIPAMQSGKVMGGSLTPYTPDIHYRSGREELSFEKDGKVLYNDKKDVVFYEVIMEAEENAIDVRHTCTCPNCGGASFIETLINEGCPYCRSQFVMKDLYPKVINYYTIETVPPAEEINAKAKKYPLIGGIAGASLALVGGIMAGYLEHGWLGIIFELLFLMLVMGGMGALLAYMAYSFSLMGRLFKMAAKSLPMLPALGSNKKLNDSLKVYDPSFSVEYFSSKAISMFRTYAYSDHPEDLSFCNISGNAVDLSDLVHSAYKGGLAVSSIREEKGIIKVDLVLYLSNYYYVNNRIRNTDEKIKVSLQHRKDLKVDRGFSLNAVECKGCGGSFKAIYQKKCPYCGREYDIALNDWEMVSIKR